MENIKMNRLYAISICALLFFISATIVPAETMYIRTVVKITLRTGPGTDHKIITMITSGDPIEVLETSGEWSKIRTLEGKEGWIVSNLITAEKPSQYIPITPVSNSIPLDQQAPLLEENKALKAENMRLESALSQNQNELSQLRVSLEGLKTASADYERVIAELKAQSETARIDEDQVIDNDFRQNVWWFLIGAGIILIGFIVGYNVKRPRARSLIS